MSGLDLTPNPTAEFKQLSILAVGLFGLAAVLFWGFGQAVPALVLLSLAVCATAGVVAFSWIGRDVFLVFALIARGIQSVVSFVLIFTIYFFFISPLGLIFRLFGMNLLDRNFDACKERRTMFRTAPASDADSFTRQS